MPCSFYIIGIFKIKHHWQHFPSHVLLLQATVAILAPFLFFLLQGNARGNNSSCEYNIRNG